MNAKVKTSVKSIREAKRADRQRRQFVWRVVWGIAGAIAVALVGYFLWIAFGPKPGQSLPIQGREHIQLGDPHEPYNSDPPTSGPHAPPVLAGFYNEAPPDENLVHNLEHGYVIIWYNCSSLDEAACETLKGQIQAVMDRAKPVSFATDAKKLIAVPRPTMEAPIALTSWGRILKLDAFDEEAIVEFIDKLRNQAPEPNAP
jgi:hypothetical protein